MSGAAGRAGAHTSARAEARRRSKVGRIALQALGVNTASTKKVKSIEGCPKSPPPPPVRARARSSVKSMADDDDVIEMDDDEDCYDVLGTGAVMKEIIREAPDVEVEYGRPEVGDQVVIAYDGYVKGMEDEERAEKMCHRKYHFTLGSDDEIKGWTDALETMSSEPRVLSRLPRSSTRHTQKKGTRARWRT